MLMIRTDQYSEMLDEELDRRFGLLVRSERELVAEMLACWIEVDRRKRWAERGYPSMFAWCRKKHRLSESVIGKRIHAARAAKRFPVILGMLRRGEIHLCAISRLARHLNEANHVAVLERARGLSKRRLEVLIAELSPKPDPKPRITAERVAASPAVASPAPTPTLELLPQRTTSLASPTVHVTPPCSGERVQVEVELRDSSPPARPARIEPRSPGRFALTVPMSEHTVGALRKLEALLSHRRNADLESIVARAIDELLERTERERTGKARRPRPTDAKSNAGTTRAPRRAARRAVWEGDDESCAYVSPDGHRCGSMHRLQVHHVEPFARGGPTNVANLSLRCAAHNRYEAERDFGVSFVEEKIRSRKNRPSAQIELDVT